MIDYCSHQDVVDCWKHNTLRRVVCQVMVTSLHVEVLEIYSIDEFSTSMLTTDDTLRVISAYGTLHYIYNRASQSLAASIWCRGFHQAPIRRVLWSSHRLPFPICCARQHVASCVYIVPRGQSRDSRTREMTKLCSDKHLNMSLACLQSCLQQKTSIQQKWQHQASVKQHWAILADLCLLKWPWFFT